MLWFCKLAFFGTSTECHCHQAFQRTLETAWRCVCTQVRAQCAAQSPSDFCTICLATL